MGPHFILSKLSGSVVALKLVAGFGPALWVLVPEKSHHMYFIQHYFICRPYDSSGPRTVATSALTVRR
jgi:hypothetical protein